MHAKRRTVGFSVPSAMSLQSCPCLFNYVKSTLQYKRNDGSPKKLRMEFSDAVRTILAAAPSVTTLAETDSENDDGGFEAAVLRVEPWAAVLEHGNSSAIPAKEARRLAVQLSRAFDAVCNMLGSPERHAAIVSRLRGWAWCAAALLASATVVDGNDGAAAAGVPMSVALRVVSGSGLFDTSTVAENATAAPRSSLSRLVARAEEVILLSASACRAYALVTSANVSHPIPAERVLSDDGCPFTAAAAAASTALCTVLSSGQTNARRSFTQFLTRGAGDISARGSPFEALCLARDVGLGVLSNARAASVRCGQTAALVSHLDVAIGVALFHSQDIVRGYANGLVAATDFVQRATLARTRAAADEASTPHAAVSSAVFSGERRLFDALRTATAQDAPAAASVLRTLPMIFARYIRAMREVLAEDAAAALNLSTKIKTLAAKPSLGRSSESAAAVAHDDVSTARAAVAALSASPDFGFLAELLTVAMGVPFTASPASGNSDKSVHLSNSCAADTAELLSTRLRTVASLLVIALAYDVYRIHEDRAPHAQAATLALVGTWAADAVRHGAANASGCRDTSALSVFPSILAGAAGVLSALLELNPALVMAGAAETVAAATDAVQVEANSNLCVAILGDAVRVGATIANVHDTDDLGRARAEIVETAAKLCAQLTTTAAKLRQLPSLLTAYISVASSQTAVSVLLHAVHAVELNAALSLLPTGQVSDIGESLFRALEASAGTLQVASERSEQRTTAAAAPPATVNGKRRKRTPIAVAEAATPGVSAMSCVKVSADASRIVVAAAFLDVFIRRLPLGAAGGGEGGARRLALWAVRLADGATATLTRLAVREPTVAASPAAALACLASDTALAAMRSFPGTLHNTPLFPVGGTVNPLSPQWPASSLRAVAAAAAASGTHASSQEVADREPQMPLIAAALQGAYSSISADASTSSGTNQHLLEGQQRNGGEVGVLVTDLVQQCSATSQNAVAITDAATALVAGRLDLLHAWLVSHAPHGDDAADVAVVRSSATALAGTLLEYPKVYLAGPRIGIAALYASKVVLAKYVQNHILRVVDGSKLPECAVLGSAAAQTVAAVGSVTNGGIGLGLARLSTAIAQGLVTALCNSVANVADILKQEHGQQHMPSLTKKARRATVDINDGSSAPPTARLAELISAAAAVSFAAGDVRSACLDEAAKWVRLSTSSEQKSRAVRKVDVSDNLLSTALAALRTIAAAAAVLPPSTMTADQCACTSLVAVLLIADVLLIIGSDAPLDGAVDAAHDSSNTCAADEVVQSAISICRFAATRGITVIPTAPTDSFLSYFVTRLVHGRISTALQIHLQSLVSAQCGLLLKVHPLLLATDAERASAAADISSLSRHLPQQLLDIAAGAELGLATSTVNQKKVAAVTLLRAAAAALELSASPRDPSGNERDAASSAKTAAAIMLAAFKFKTKAVDSDGCRVDFATAVAAATIASLCVGAPETAARLNQLRVPDRVAAALLAAPASTVDAAVAQALIYGVAAALDRAEMACTVDSKAAVITYSLLARRFVTPAILAVMLRCTGPNDSGAIERLIRHMPLAAAPTLAAAVQRELSSGDDRAAAIASRALASIVIIAGDTFLLAATAVTSSSNKDLDEDEPTTGSNDECMADATIATSSPRALRTAMLLVLRNVLPCTLMTLAVTGVRRNNMRIAAHARLVRAAMSYPRMLPLRVDELHGALSPVSAAVTAVAGRVAVAAGHGLSANGTGGAVPLSGPAAAAAIARQRDVVVDNLMIDIGSRPSLRSHQAARRAMLSLALFKLPVALLSPLQQNLQSALSRA